MKKLILLTALLFFACGHTVDIEQKVSVDDYCDCTYWIKTTVWVEKHWGQTTVSLEHLEYRHNVPQDEVETVKQREYEIAEVVADRMRQCIKEKTCP